MSITPISAVTHTTPAVKKGTCYLLFAFEIGNAINLDLAASHIKEVTERTRFRRNRKAPKYFDYDPPPLRITQHGQQVNVGRFFTKPQADLTLFDFGACSVCYEIDIHGPLGHMVELSDVLYDNAFLLEDAREHVKQLSDEIKISISRPLLGDSIEDFTIYHIEQMEGAVRFPDLIKDHGIQLANILCAETGELSEEEIKESLETRTSYSSGDCTIIDWNAAFVFGTKIEDNVAVLEFCNVELLEMRFLDEQLDDYLEQAYQTLTTGKKGGGDLRKVARLQVDSAILYEAVENALKLLGDQYLARVYSLASAKFHLTEWNTSILRKLDTLDSIYQKLSDHASQRRSETLELVVILLILVEVVMGLLKH